MRGTRAEKITLYNAKKPSNISARLIQSSSKTQTPFPKSDRRERTHGADEKDEGAAVRSSTSAAEMKQSCRADPLQCCRATWISSRARLAGLARRETGIDVPVCLTAHGEILAPLPGI